MYYVLKRTDTNLYRGRRGAWRSDIRDAEVWSSYAAAVSCAASLSADTGATVVVEGA